MREWHPARCRKGSTTLTTKRVVRLDTKRVADTLSAPDFYMSFSRPRFLHSEGFELPFDFLAWFRKTPAPEPESEFVRQLRGMGARLQLDDGNPVSVVIEHTADDDTLARLAEVPTLESVSIEWSFGVTDQGLRKLSGLPKLSELRLPASTIDGSGFDAFEGHPALEVLDLDGSSINDAAMEHISRIPHLQMLFVRYCEITDAVLPHLRSLPELSVLHLDGTQVTGAGLPELRKFKKLEVLSLPSKILPDELQHLNGMGSLRFLWLGDADVSPQSVEDLKSTLNPTCSVGWRRGALANQ